MPPESRNYARIGARPPAGKRAVNLRKNRIRDSAPESRHASRIDSRLCVERAMNNKTLVLGLLLACIANVICLVGYL